MSCFAVQLMQCTLTLNCIGDRGLDVANSTISLTIVRNRCGYLHISVHIVEVLCRSKSKAANGVQGHQAHLA